jgi:hypothetical protein
MSYNIDTWRTKTLEDLVIPMDAIKALPYVEISNNEDEVHIGGTTDCFEMVGLWDNGMLSVEKIEYSGEGSGHCWDAFKNMLSKSTGNLVAAQVWEGGDSITRLTVKDGVVSEENVEI